MKKIETICTVLALVFAVSFMFTACDNGGGGGGDTTPPPPITAGLYFKEDSHINADDVPLVAFDKTDAANTFNAAIDYVKTNRSRFYILVLDGDVSVGTGIDLNAAAPPSNFVSGSAGRTVIGLSPFHLPAHFLR